MTNDVEGPHNWIASTLGHGETYCTQCHATNREIMVIGDMNRCPRAVSQDDPKPPANNRRAR